MKRQIETQFTVIIHLPVVWALIVTPAGHFLNIHTNEYHWSSFVAQHELHFIV